MLANAIQIEVRVGKRPGQPMNSLVPQLPARELRQHRVGRFVGEAVRLLAQHMLGRVQVVNGLELRRSKTIPVGQGFDKAT